LKHLFQQAIDFVRVMQADIEKFFRGDFMVEVDHAISVSSHPHQISIGFANNGFLE